MLNYYARTGQRERGRQVERERYHRDIEASRKRGREKYRNNPDIHLKKSARYRKAHPERIREWKLRWDLRQYGLTTDQYDQMLSVQGGGCAICGGLNKSGKRLFVDHDHETGEVRGLLCNPCNRGVGNIVTPELLRKAADYLERGIEIHPVLSILDSSSSQ